MGTIINAEPPPDEAARPLRTTRTGRPGGSGAQPPLHLIHMVRVELPSVYFSLPTTNCLRDMTFSDCIPLELTS